MLSVAVPGVASSLINFPGIVLYYYYITFLISSYMVLNSVWIRFEIRLHAIIRGICFPGYLFRLDLSMLDSNLVSHSVIHSSFRN